MGKAIKQRLEELDAELNAAMKEEEKGVLDSIQSTQSRARTSIKTAETEIRSTLGDVVKRSDDFHTQLVNSVHRIKANEMESLAFLGRLPQTLEKLSSEEDASSQDFDQSTSFFHVNLQDFDQSTSFF